MSEHGSGSGTSTGYKVEVRTTYHAPTVIGTFVIDGTWREWPVQEGAAPFGANVPIARLDRRLIEVGLLSYVAAEAHRWALLAALDAHKVMGALCIETRLVEVQLNYQYSTKETGVMGAKAYTPYAKAVTPREKGSNDG